MLHHFTQTYAMLDPRFGRDPAMPIELDMGCGFGRFTLALAARQPDRLILANDLNRERLHAIEHRASRRGLVNLELLYANHLWLAAFLFPDACLRRVHLLCPDPWPKARHRARRVVTSDFLTRIARILEPGGILHMATDHGPYEDTLRETADGLDCFALAPPETLDDVRDLETNFERLWHRQGKDVPHLAYRKKGCLP